MSDVCMSVQMLVIGATCSGCECACGTPGFPRISSPIANNLYIAHNKGVDA